MRSYGFSEQTQPPSRETFRVLGGVYGEGSGSGLLCAQAFTHPPTLNLTHSLEGTGSYTRKVNQNITAQQDEVRC